MATFKNSSKVFYDFDTSKTKQPSDKSQSWFVKIAKKAHKSIIESSCEQNKKKVETQCYDTLIDIHDTN